MALGIEDFSYSQGDRMNIHKNARLTPRSRGELVRRVMEVAKEVGVLPATVSRVLQRLGLKKLNALALAMTPYLDVIAVAHLG